MSNIAELLRAGRPDWALPIPEELERAWIWLESQGYGSSFPAGYFLSTAPGEQQLGPVFTDSLSLEGWFEPGTEAHARLLPIAEITGDGSFAALWDDGGAIRVVALGSDGGAFMLANHAREFLALLALGYRELDRWWIVDVPDDEEAIAGVADFRAWVEAQGIDLPEHWQVDDDAFTAWVAQQLG